MGLLDLAPGLEHLAEDVGPLRRRGGLGLARRRCGLAALLGPLLKKRSEDGAEQAAAIGIGLDLRIGGAAPRGPPGTPAAPPPIMPPIIWPKMSWSWGWAAVDLARPPIRMEARTGSIAFRTCGPMPLRAAAWSATARLTSLEPNKAPSASLPWLVACWVKAE